MKILRHTITSENNSGIIPLEYYVLVKLDVVEEKTKGGILLIAETQERETQAQASGNLVAIGPLAFIYDVDNSIIPQLGDKVAFPKYGGQERTGKDGARYRLLKDGDLTAILAE